MKIIDVQNPVRDTVITIGTFDGVHLGHRAILRRLKQRAKELNLTDLVITFRLPPRLILNPSAQVKVLTLIDEKIQLIAQQGICCAYILPFDRTIAELSAKEFVEQYLLERFGLKHLIVGYDHRFGRSREAGFEELRQMGKYYGFSVEQVEPVEVDGQKVSSSYIRTLLSQGHLEKANRMLGYEYCFSGKVIKGKLLGKKLGFPTANLLVNPLKQMPKYGVYLVKVGVDGQWHWGVLNYGLRPTVDQDASPKAEVHILDFAQNLYGKMLRVRLVARLRDEQRFDSIEQLRQQIQKDILLARELIERY